MERKGFSDVFILIVVGLVLIAGVGGYFVWKNSTKPPIQVQPSPIQQSLSNNSSILASTTSINIAGWKTYTNTQYGFSFQYPGTWIDAGNSITGGYYRAQGDQLSDASSGISLDVISEGGAGQDMQFIADDEFGEPAPGYCPGSQILSSTTNTMFYFVSFNQDAKGNFVCTATSSSYKYVFENANGTFIELAYNGEPTVIPSGIQIPSVLNEIVKSIQLIPENPPQLIKDQYNIFIQSTSSAENGYFPNVQYADDGTVSSGKYEGYHRLMATVPDPDGEDYYNIILATADYKTFIVDNSSSTSDWENDVITYNPAKVIAFDTIPLDAPPPIISLGNFVLQQDEISPDPIESSTELTSSVPGLAFYADVDANPYEDYGAGYTVATSTSFLSYSDDVLVKTATGPAYDYSLLTEEEFSRSSSTNDGIDYGDSVSFYQDAEISSTAPHYEAYGQILPGQCGGELATYVLKNISASDLVQIGTTAGGVILYAPKDPNNSLNKVQYDIKENYNQEGGYDTVFPTYQQYISKNPVLVIQDPWGRYLGLGELDYPTVGGCGKPVIYLYPPKPTEVSLKFTTPMRLTTDIPTYAADGWDVLAKPDGELTDLQPQFTPCAAIDSTAPGSEYAASACEHNDYPYLYWEGQASGQYPTPSGGWIVPQAGVADFLNQKLSAIGLTDKEKNDMTSYWVPELLAKNAPYYRISFFQTAQMDQFIPMDVTPKPDTVIRVFLDWSPLAAMPAVQLQPETLNHIDRKGFTLVEWGGLKQ